MSSMAPEYAGRGEPRRSLDLLWGDGPRPRRGPKPGLSVEAVVAAAIAVADAEGIGALSMRRVADHLGRQASERGSRKTVGAMSLYTYVPAKAELLDLMLDTVFAEQVSAIRAATTAGPPDDPLAELTVDWRAGLEARARADWALYHRHPWMLQLAHARSVLGPNEMAAYDASLRLVDGLGLSGREMVAVVDLVAVYVGGAARGAIEAAAAPAATGMTDTEWWVAREQILIEKMSDATRFPTVVRVSEQGGFDVAPDAVDYNLAFAVDDFEFGLQRVLDGIERLIESRRKGRRATRTARQSS